MIAASRQTFVANIAQQLCAALLILVLPNLLSKADYAQIVYVGVLLSFAGFSDMGMSLAYGRVVPALHAGGKLDELRNWNGTSLKFGLLTSAVYSCILAGLYWLRYHNLLHALLLLPVPFIVFWFSFHVGRVSSTGDFRDYRLSITWRALASLICIPLVMALGLTGWFVGLLSAAALTLARLGKRLREPMDALDWSLVRAHLREGLLLATISVVWMQLLNFARLYASLRYGAEDIAMYGIVAAGYQSLSLLIISLFLPVSVGILGRYHEGVQSALNFAHHILMRSILWVVVVTVIGIFAAPPVLAFFFPSYHFATVTVTLILLGLMLHPFFIVWGNVLVAEKCFLRYLLAMLVGIATGVTTAQVVDIYYPTDGAAWGQTAGITAFTLMAGLMVRARTHGLVFGILHQQILSFLLVLTILFMLIMQQ